MAVEVHLQLLLRRRRQRLEPGRRGQGLWRRLPVLQMLVYRVLVRSMLVYRVLVRWVLVCRAQTHRFQATLQRAMRLQAS